MEASLCVRTDSSLGEGMLTGIFRRPLGSWSAKVDLLAGAVLGDGSGRLEPRLLVLMALPSLDFSGV